jgi:hypothetical protein
MTASNAPLQAAQKTRVARNWLAGVLLFAATATVVLWQNAHLTVLWDLSYVLETSLRFSQGQMPYRDFPLVHPPLTFAVQAVLIKLFGRHMIVQALYAACAGGLGSVLSWRILLGLLRGLEEKKKLVNWLGLLLAAPLIVVGLYCIFPHPSYDCDTALAVLLSLFLLQRLDWPKADARAGFIAGAVAVLPSLYKQNIGLPYLFAVLALIALLLGKSWLHFPEARAERKKFFSFLAGVAAALAASLLVIELTAGLGNYLHWIVRFAGERRMPGFSVMLGVYQCMYLLWALPCTLAGAQLLRASAPWARSLWSRLGALALLAAPWLYVLVQLPGNLDDPDSFGDCFLGLWPLVLVLAELLLVMRIVCLFRDRSAKTAVAPLLALASLGAIHGTMMSQQLWGSTYSLWPFLLFLLADCLLWLHGPHLTQNTPPTWLIAAFAGIVSLVLLVCGGYYTASEERLSYADLPEGPALHSTTPALAALATPGPYLANLDELVRYTDRNIPMSDAIVLLPGEDPFYFATGRTVQFPVLLFDPSTDPYTPADVLRLVHERQVKWLIVKRVEQIHADPTPERAATLAILGTEFKLAAQLSGYDVYRR